MKSDDKLPEACTGPSWREIRLDINPEAEPDIVGDIRATTQPAPFTDIVALAIKSA